MPYVTNMQDDEEQQKAPSQGAVPASGGAPMQLTPASGVIGAGGTGGSPKPPTSQGGQFASLNQYLSANMGKAEPLAGKLTSGIGKEYQGLEGQNQQALSSIGGQVSAQPDYSKANETITQEAANPVSFANDQGNVASFQNLLKASYAGPTSAESTKEYANQQAAVNKAISQGQQAVQTNAGRENLLTKNEARPTAGVTALNNAILSASPTALSSVEGAYKPFQNLLTGLQSGATEANKAIAGKQAQAEAAKKASTEAITSQMGGLNTAVGNELTTAQQNLAAQNNAIKTELASGKLSDATLKAIGLKPEDWQKLSDAQKAAATSQNVLSDKGQFGATTGTTNIDLANFLSQSDPNAVLNAANVATPEDYAKAQAFQTLLGNLGLEAPTLAINPNAAAQARTAPTNLNQFDYQTALQTAQQAKADQMAAAQAYVNALQSGADEEHAQLAAQKAAKTSMANTAASIAYTPVGATEAAASGLVGAGKNVYNQFSSAPKAIKNLAANVLTGGLATPAQAVAKGVQQAAKTVAKIFCFHPDTLIAMENGSLMPIHKIAVGDMTRGGKVLATTRAVGEDFYWYNGVIVTGKHAVKEDGRWVRVENARLGHRINLRMEIVCNLVTESHRIFAHGIEFADQYETDQYESLDMDESLSELNMETTKRKGGDQ